jgi:hypothetical protein
MDMTALLLSRIQFAFTIRFHIIFPSFRYQWRLQRQGRSSH